MAFVPFQNLAIHSPLPPEEALSRLAGAVEPEMKTGKRWIFDPNAKPYEGEIVGTEFKIRRVIGYRNSFLPRISGKVEKTDSGSKISIKMGLSVKTKILAGLWLVFAALFGGAADAVCAAVLPERTFPVSKIPGLFFAPACYVILTVFFRLESKKSAAFFHGLFAR